MSILKWIEFMVGTMCTQAVRQSYVFHYRYVFYFKLEWNIDHRKMEWNSFRPYSILLQSVL